MKPYPAYKPTGLAWLPEVPRGWEMLRLKSCFYERKENNRSSNQMMILSLMKDIGVIPYDEKGDVGNKSKDDISQYKVARRGDLVLNSMNVIIGSVGVTPYDGLISPAYYSLVPRENVLARFYEFMFRLPAVQQAFRGYAKGIMEIRLRISTIDLLGMKFPVPPPAEQEAIVAYLDEKTAKIDRLIELKEREIKLLNEKKQAVISKVVTRGLDPNAEAPLWPLKHITTKIGSGKTPSGGANVYVSTGVMFIRSQNVYYNEIRTDDISCITEAVDSEMAGTRVKKGDVLLNITGGSIGRCACFNLDVRANVNQHVCIIRPNSDIVDSEYLAAVIFSDVVQTQIWQCQNEGNRESLNFDQIARFRIPLPSLSEQREIVAYLDAEGAKTDKAIAAVTRQIGLLKEYRTRLISDAVTGRIDLRKL